MHISDWDEEKLSKIENSTKSNSYYIPNNWNLWTHRADFEWVASTSNPLFQIPVYLQPWWLRGGNTFNPIASWFLNFRIYFNKRISSIMPMKLSKRVARKSTSGCTRLHPESNPKHWKTGKLEYHCFTQPEILDITVSTQPKDRNYIQKTWEFSGATVNRHGSECLGAKNTRIPEFRRIWSGYPIRYDGRSYFM